MKTVEAVPASPWKRLFAWMYDLLPAAGVLVLVFVVGFALSNLILFDTPADQVSKTIGQHPLWWAYLIVATAFYYLYCWVKGGQTVGLRTWRLMLIKENGSRLNWQESIIRALVSLGGLGNLWAFFDKDNRAIHDIAVNAYLVQLPKISKTKDEEKPLI